MCLASRGWVSLQRCACDSLAAIDVILFVLRWAGGAGTVDDLSGFDRGEEH
jgi:hypothetical protein